MICDAHHHLWSREDNPYDVADLRADLATMPEITRTVFVECGAWYRDSGPEHLRVVGETEWVAEHADPVTEAIVGTADLRQGGLATEVLEAHVEAGRGKFRGIRQRAVWDASPQIRATPPDAGPSLLLDDDFRKGVAVLTGMGLSFDAWLYFPQLPELVDLARAFAETTIVLNHLGGPITLGPYADREAMLETWRPLIADVATCPNVVLKLGGIGMPIYGASWHKQAEPPTAADVAAVWRDPIRFCIDAFGVERCMFESNFPVDKLSMGYATIWEAFELMVDDVSAAERAALFHDTAVRAYRLPEHTGG